MVITTKPVNTTIPEIYHKRAKVHGIEWTEALMLGIDILNNDDYNKETKLIRKIKKLKGEVKIFERRLVELRSLREHKEGLLNLTKKEINFLETVPGRLERGAKIDAIVRFFNNNFKRSLSQEDLEFILKERVRL